MDKPPASIALDQLGIPHRVFHHEKPVTSFEQAAADRNQRPEQIVRSILFQVRPGEFVWVNERPEGFKKISSFANIKNFRFGMDEPSWFCLSSHYNDGNMEYL